MTESKEAMQNTIKNLQAKSDYIYKLEDKGSKTVVLQLGSHTIKMGFANEKAPFNISPFVAYRTDKPQAEAPVSEEEFDYEWFKNEYHKTEAILKSEGTISIDNKPFKGKPRAKQVVNIDRIPEYNPDHTSLFGDEALRVEQNPNWIFRKVITHGALNISCEQDQKQRISDLENLLVHLIKNKIKIPEKEWESFNCIVIVPDIFIRRHLKMIIHSIFHRIGFKKIYVHLESVMACFGTAVSSACVVDIGHQKINICCVDEGVIIPKTLVKKNFGSKDISKILTKIFNDRITQNTIGSLKHNMESDLYHIDRIKQIACAVKEPQETINRLYEISPIRKDTEIAVQIAYTDSICIASNSFFNQIWNAFEMPLVKDPFNLYSKYYDLYEDPEDFFEEYSGGGHIYEIGYDVPTYDESICDPFIYQPIEDMIMASLLSIKDVDVRKKFMANILIIGGGAHLPKLAEEIVIRINTKLDINSLEDKVEIATDLLMRQIAPIHASWLGGTVIPKLDSLRDLWIEREKFLGDMSMDVEEEEENIIDKKLFTRKEQSQEWGIRYLKEKVPFLW